MFSELVVLGIFCMFTKFKINKLFNRRKYEKDSFGCNRGGSIFIS